MSVAATNAYSTATGNGAATSFPFTFACQNVADVSVYVNGVIQNSGYSVTLNSDFNGGTVLFSVAPANAATIIIASVPAFTQQIQFENAGPYNPASVDNALDAAAIRAIFLNGLLARTALVPVGETMGPLPAKASRAGLFFGFDANGNPVAVPSTGSPASNQSALLGSANLFTYSGPSPTIEVPTPNNGTTGGLRIRANATSGKAILQYTDAAAGAEFANIVVTNGNVAFSCTVQAPTQSPSDNSTKVATTAYVTTAVANMTGGGAPLNSPAFTGTPTAPTPTVGNNTTQIATTAYVITAVSAYAPTASPTFTGTITASSATLVTGTNANSIGYLGIPQNAQTAAYVLALSDIGKHISITTGGVTIPANSSVAFPVGSMIGIFNNSASNQTIAITTDTLHLAGSASTGSRTLAQYGWAAVLKVSSTVWIIFGAGLT